MKFSVLALDFDGTIAEHDRIDPAVRAAIAAVRAHDIAVVLVTGRRLDDLRRVAGDLHFVAAVVGENGGVLEFPSSGYAAVLGQPVPPKLIELLRQEAIAFDVGQVIVEAAAADAGRILGVLQRAELPLVMAFNRSRVMVLPQSISKATGLREVLRVLRLSMHNAMAIGDAENDHELLRFCEYGVAVGWGSEFLKASADAVLPGNSPAAVAPFLNAVAAERQLPVAARSRRWLGLGHADDGQPLGLAVRGRNVLIAGEPKSGKSWVTGLLSEQLILQGYCVCVLDAEGDYTSLHALPGVTVMGGANPLPKPIELVRALRHPDGSIVIDLSHQTHAAKLEYFNTTLPALAALRRHTGFPHRIVVDEAHYFLHTEAAVRLLDLELNGYTLVTYRASQLHPRVLASVEAIVVTRESDPREVAVLLDACAQCSTKEAADEWRRVLTNLAIGEAVVLPITSEAAGVLRRIRLAPRLTPHVRHQAKYMDIPVAPSRAFVFWPQDSPAGPRVDTLRGFVQVLEESPEPSLHGHLRRSDFSRWIGDVFGDRELAGQVNQLEAQFRSGERPTVTRAIVEAVRQRYDFARIEPVPAAEVATAVT
ncbi:MAG: HAD hydrolase family protein [Acidobacteriota bacterium]